jgi:hypothetical protein
VRKTTQISFSCKISGFTFYWLEFDDAIGGTGSYYFCRDVKASDYNKNNTNDFLNPVYKIDNTLMSECSVSPNNPAYFFLRLPIIRDSVVMQDFYAFEDKTVASTSSTWNAGTYTVPTGGTYQVGSGSFTLPKGYVVDIHRPYETTKECQHEPYTYIGLTQTDTYCKKCEKKL